MFGVHYKAQSKLVWECDMLGLINPRASDQTVTVYIVGFTNWDFVLSASYEAPASEGYPK